LEGVPAERIAVIHNWSDGSEITPLLAANNALRAKWGLSNKFVVGYSGNLGRAHEYKTILNAAEMLRDDNEIRFLFIGGGHLMTSLSADARRRGLTNIIIQPYQQRDRLSESLSTPDLHLVALLPALEGLIVPSKFYSIAAAARPIIFIGDRSGEIPRLLRDANCGAAVGIGEVLRLVRHIKHLKQDAALRLLWGGNARTLLDQRFDKRFAIDRWIGLLDKLAVSPATDVADKIRSNTTTADLEVAEKG
jgi:glycosyltransferase involved in cell wall biosynthesis